MAVRLATWPQVFTGAGVRFVVDSDTYYHALRARQIVEHFPRFSRFDDGLNYPLGATVLWPPLFDYAIAVPAWLLGGAPGTVERVAAVLPLLLGVGAVLLLRSVARRFVGEAAFTAALLLALAPGSIAYTLLGRPDQHAAEALLAIALAGGFLAAAESGRRSGGALVAGLLAAAFWTWQGSGLLLVLLGSVTAAWHLAGDGARGSRALALAAGAAALLLALSLGLFAPGALQDLGGRGVTGFHVLLCAAAAAFGGLLWLAELRAGPRGIARRGAEVVAAAALVTGAALGAGASAGVLTNLSALAAGNRWYLSIVEFQPLTTFDGVGGTLSEVSELTGALLLALPLGAVAGVRRWRSGDRAGALFLAVWLGLFLLATLARRRFVLYLAPPLALAAAAGLELAAARLRGAPGWLRERALPVAAAVLLSLPGLRPLCRGFPVGGVEALAPALAWLREAPVRDGRPAVLSDWSLGHVVRYFGRRPVVSSPFGVDGGPGAMEDAARFFLAEDAGAAEALLRARRVGAVVLQNVAGEVFIGQALVPSPEHVRLRSRSVDVFEYEVTPRFWGLVSARLYFRDGAATSDGEAIAGLRLVFETPPEAPGPPAADATRVFEVVPGAVLRGAASPGTRVVASVPVLTNAGRDFTWVGTATADAEGAVALRVPYATGRNGFVVAQRYAVEAGGATRLVAVDEAAVTEGVTIELR